MKKDFFYLIIFWCLSSSYLSKQNKNTLRPKVILPFSEMISSKIKTASSRNKMKKNQSFLTEKKSTSSIITRHWA